MPQFHKTPDYRSPEEQIAKVITDLRFALISSPGNYTVDQIQQILIAATPEITAHYLRGQ